MDNFVRWLANGDAFDALKRGESPAGITRSWATSLEEFRRARAKVLLYD
jgi:hypothetical protein